MLSVAYNGNSTPLEHWKMQSRLGRDYSAGTRYNLKQARVLNDQHLSLSFKRQIPYGLLYGGINSLVELSFTRNSHVFQRSEAVRTPLTFPAPAPISPGSATSAISLVLISWSTFTTPSNQERSSPIGPLLRIYHGFRWRHPSSPSQSEARVWAQGKQVIETYHDAG
ncbi:unnamed protein product [Fusarium graminearum]|nr:unnamed protein product [Fusarium graminearum]